MQRLRPLPAVLLTIALLALPAAADAPSGWQKGAGVSGSFSALQAESASVAVAGAHDGALVRTSDGGQSWTPVTAPGNAGLVDVGTMTPGTLFALDSAGTLRRSQDDGVSWTAIPVPAGVHPLAASAFGGQHLLVAARRALFVSDDQGDHFASVTPKLAPGDGFRGIDRAGGVHVAFGARTLMVANASARDWRHMRLPRLARGDFVLTADFVTGRTGFVLTSFRRLYKTTDAGHHWRELLGTGGAGQDIAFADARRGWIAAPGFANRFDGVVLHTTDGGATWRPQTVTSRFISHVSSAAGRTYAIGDEGTSLFATDGAGEPGSPITVGFRPVPRVARRGQVVRIHGRLDHRLRSVGVAVSMRSGGRWIVRFVHTDARGVFAATFTVARRSTFVVQVPSGDGHGSAATHPVSVRVAR